MIAGFVNMSKKNKNVNKRNKLNVKRAKAKAKRVKLFNKRKKAGLTSQKSYMDDDNIDEAGNDLFSMSPATLELYQSLPDPSEKEECLRLIEERFANSELVQRIPNYEEQKETLINIIYEDYKSEDPNYMKNSLINILNDESNYD